MNREKRIWKGKQFKGFTGEEIYNEAKRIEPIKEQQSYMDGLKSLSKQLETGLKNKL